MRITILGRNKIGSIEGNCKKEDYGTNLTDLAIATANQGTSSIVTYFSKLHELWAEFDCLAPAGCDCPKSSEYKIFMWRQKLSQFLMGLNETYEQAREQIMMIDPLPTVNQDYSMLMERESLRSMANLVVPGDNVKMTAMLNTKGFILKSPGRIIICYMIIAK
uniref:Uncharacterized protein LOC104215031 n=1 Tax=Nicotiana sylvestris TaxID=4096 RepID=A0A1U7VMI0_NICSY|nr:PREDICTED: uncharacterized protein LOC104215031 [Nicotiana sylvestris]